MASKGWLFVWIVVAACVPSHKIAQAPARRPVAESIAVSSQSVTARYVELADRRDRQIELLDAYIESGLFPKNSFHPERTPYFVDPHGTPCAVAHLMQQAGEGKTVDAIRRTNNDVRVADVTEGPLFDWIQASGLTQEEAAQIQPAYREHRNNELKTAAELEQERIQQHLRRVHHALVQDTPRSLTAILQSLLPDLRHLIGVESVGFVIDGPSQVNRQLVNRASATLHVLVTRREAGIVVTDEQWQEIPAGGTLELPTTEQQQVFVEWRSDAKLAPFSLELQQASALSFETRSLHLDRVYASMRGPEHSQVVQLMPNGPRQLLWLRGVSVVAIEGDPDHHCHTNIDRTQLHASSPAHTTRLFTLSRGQTELSLPEGTAIPVWSDEPLRIVTQASNPHATHAGHSVRFRTTFDVLPDTVAAHDPIALYPAVATSLKLLRVGETATQHHHAEGSSEPLVSGQGGALSTWHWQLPPGKDVTTTHISDQIDLVADTMLHFVGVHVHRHAEQLSLWDRTQRVLLFQSDIRRTPDGEIDAAGTFSSREGIPLRAGHDYELVSAYDNRSTETADAMATVFLYLRDPETPFSIAANRAFISNTLGLMHLP